VAVVAYFMILYRHSHGQTEGNYVKPESVGRSGLKYMTLPAHQYASITEQFAECKGC
jgi:hypothetical protein